MEPSQPGDELSEPVSYIRKDCFALAPGIRQPNRVRMTIGILAVALAAGAVVGVAVLAVEWWRTRIPPFTEWQRGSPYFDPEQGPEAAERLQLAKREASLARRERIVEEAMADAQRRFAQATARIEEREAALASRESELQQQESALADRQQSLAERELTVSARERPRSFESDWWDKQLGHPRSPEE